MLHVPGDEPRPAGAGGAERLDVQPQLRGPAGQGRAYPPRLGAGRRGYGGRPGPRQAPPPCTPRLGGEKKWGRFPPTPALRSPPAPATSTPTRSSPPSTSSG